MADFRMLEDKLEALSNVLRSLSITSATPISLVPPTIPPTVPSTTSTKSILDIRPLETEIREVMNTIRPVSASAASSSSRSSRPPPMPTFGGSDFPLWLKRWSRWSKIAGLEGVEESTARAWFVHAMEEPVLTVVESLFDKTSTLEDLIRETSRIFPTYVTDLSLRKQVSEIRGLPAEPSLEEVETLLLDLETLWSRMSDDAYSDQEKYVTLAGKLGGKLWESLRSHPTFRATLQSYNGLKAAVRGFVSERLVDKNLADLYNSHVRRSGRPLLAIGDEPRLNRTKEDLSAGFGVKAKVSCKFCGRTGHYDTACWKKFPEQRPKFIPKAPPKKMAKPPPSRPSKPPAPSSKPPASVAKPSPQPSQSSQADRPDPESDERRKRPRNVLPLHLLKSSKNGGGLLHCEGSAWGRSLVFLLDSGAALEGVVAKKLLPADVEIDSRKVRLIKVGDGRVVWTLGEVEASVVLGAEELMITFTVLETTAFDAMLGINFLRRPEVTGLTFHPPTLIIRGTTIPLKSGGEGGDMYPLTWHQESYRLVPHVQEKVWEFFRMRPEVDLFANHLNKVCSLYASPKSNAFRFDWKALHDELGPLWINPPFSRMEEVMTKVAMEPCIALIVAPDWETPTARRWKRLLDRLSVARLDLEAHEGTLFTADSGRALPFPPWRCSVSLVNSRANRLSAEELNERAVAWISKTSQKLSQNSLEGQLETQEQRNHKDDAATSPAKKTAKTPETAKPQVASIPASGKTPAPVVSQRAKMQNPEDLHENGIPKNPGVFSPSSGEIPMSQAEYQSKEGIPGVSEQKNPVPEVSGNFPSFSAQTPNSPLSRTPKVNSAALPNKYDPARNSETAEDEKAQVLSSQNPSAGHPALPNQETAQCSVQETIKAWLQGLREDEEADALNGLYTLDTALLSLLSHPHSECKLEKTSKAARKRAGKDVPPAECLEGKPAAENSDDSALSSILQDNAEAFKPMEYNPDNEMVCHFDLLPSHKQVAISCRGYPLAEKERADLHQQVQELMQKGFVVEVQPDDQPQVLSPAFLVAKHDGGRRLVIDYSRLNRAVAPCALPLPLMEPLLDSLALCRFKSKLDLQAGFWQVRLTEAASRLTAFITPEQEVYRFRVLPMGLAVSPGVFQNFTSRHVRHFKADPAVRALVRQGAVLDVMMDDFVLGAPTKDLHDELLQRWLRYAIAHKLFFKRSKCEFAKEELQVLGRLVGFRRWGPLPEQLAKAMSKKPTSVPELRSMLGSVNWVRRHVVDITPVHLLSDLLRKGKKWEWTAEHEEAWLRLVEALRCAMAVHSPQPNLPMMLVTDASDLGGGGALLQLQHLEGEAEERFVFLGHWGWKWSGARARYPAFEKELLCGVLLLASQRQMVSMASAVLWLTDAAAVPDFIKAAPPPQPRRARWWYFLHQFPLVARHVPGQRNELADHLSRVQVEERLGETIDSAAKEAFIKMDEDLDLVLIPAPSMPHLSGMLPATVALFPFLSDLSDGSSLIQEGTLWAREGEFLLREGLLFIPPDFLPSLFHAYHPKLGHPSADRLFSFLKVRYSLHGPSAALLALRRLSDQCGVCVRTKPGRPRDRGPQASLPIPEHTNAEIAVDLVHLGSGGQSEACALFMMCTLSFFIRVVPCAATLSQDEAASIIHHQWIVPYGAPGTITADNDGRWRNAPDSPAGVWGDLLRLYGITMHFTTPYASRTNGRCERRVQEFLKTLRATSLHHPQMALDDRILVAASLVNAQPRLPTGVSAAELFLGRPQWLDAMLPVLPTSHRLSEWKRAVDATVEAMKRQRTWRRERASRYAPPSDIVPGKYVYVHARRFPSHPRHKISSPWLGPFLVKNKREGEATVLVGQHPLRVHLTDLKIAPDVTVEGEGDIPLMTEEEMAAEGTYIVDKVSRHRRTPRGGFEVLTHWRMGGPPTWRPLTDFVIDLGPSGLRLQDDLAEYVAGRGDAALTAAAERLLRTPAAQVGCALTAPPLAALVHPAAPTHPLSAAPPHPSQTTGESVPRQRSSAARRSAAPQRMALMASPSKPPLLVF